jgi:hypothetical protein
VSYARAELRRAGLYDTDGDYGGALGPAILGVVKTFAAEGHSGFSAGIALAALEKLLRFQPLTPLTGADDEWNEVGDGMWQNKRCGHVFRDADGSAYDLDGIVFRDGTGTYTNSASRTPVTFPYVPVTKIVDVRDDKEPVG